MRKKKRFTTDKEILELYHKGFNDYEIAKRLDVSRTQIWNKRKKLKLTPVGRNKNS